VTTQLQLINIIIIIRKLDSNSLTKTKNWRGRNEVIEAPGRLHLLWPQDKRLHTPWKIDYRHTRQDWWIQTELVSTLAKNATKPNTFEIILVQTTRKENNWKTEETLERAVVTLETERIKGSNPWCLWWRHPAVLSAVTDWCFGDTYFLCLHGKTFLTLKTKGAFSTGILLKKNCHTSQRKLMQSALEDSADEASVLCFSGVTFILRPSKISIQQIGYRGRVSKHESPKIKVQRVIFWFNVRNLAHWYQITCWGKNEELSAAFRS